MTDNERINLNKKDYILDAFRNRTTLSFEIEIDNEDFYLIKHMCPSSVGWFAQKGDKIEVTCTFEQYHPTFWELFKDWFHSTLFRHERYWKKEDFRCPIVKK